MKKILSMLLLVATLLTLSCSKEESDTGSTNDGAYSGSYSIKGMNVDGSASGEMSLYIDVKNKLATVTMKSMAFHVDMTPIDIVFANIPYDEEDSSSLGAYIFTADSITAQSTSGEIYGDDRALITNIIVRTDYSNAYVKFYCEVEGYGVYEFLFTTYED